MTKDERGFSREWYQATRQKKQDDELSGELGCACFTGSLLHLPFMNQGFKH